MRRPGLGVLGVALAACLGAASAGAATLTPISIERSVSLTILEYPLSGGSITHFDDSVSSSAAGAFTETLSNGFLLTEPPSGPESFVEGLASQDSLVDSASLWLDLEFMATEDPLFSGGPSPAAQVIGGSSFSLVFSVDEDVDFVFDYVLFGPAAPGAAYLELENLTGGGFLIQLDSLGGGGGPEGQASGTLTSGVSYALRAGADGYYCTCSREAPGGSVSLDLAVTPVPEPGTACLLGLGLSGLALRGRSSRRRPTRAAPGTR